MLRSSFIGLALTSSFTGLALTSLVAVAGVDGCTAQQAKSADAVAIDLTNAVCSIGEQQPIGQPFVDVVCVIAQGTEQGISIATSAAAASDGGAALASTAIASTKIVHLHLTKEQAATILGLHPVTAAPAASK